MIIIPGQGGTYRHSRDRVTHLLAESGQRPPRPPCTTASYTKDLAPLERIMRDAMAFPLYDGGKAPRRTRSG
jgi:hypothetical protein